MQRSTVVPKGTTPATLRPGMHVSFSDSNRIYCGHVVGTVSPGGWGTVVGFGFNAEHVPPNACTLLSPYEEQ